MYLSKKLIAGIVAIVAIAASTTAFAAIPDGSGVIHGCYDTKTGTLRVIDSGSNGFSLSCAPKEAGLTWNQQGPKGDPGPSDSYVATWPTLQLNPGENVDVAKLTLPPGKYLLFGKTYAESVSAQTSRFHCTLANDGEYVDTNANEGMQDAAIALISSYETNAGGQVTFTCNSTAFGYVNHVRLVAVKVANLTTS
jgi:hypothetical protein